MNAIYFRVNALHDASWKFNEKVKYVTSIWACFFFSEFGGRRTIFGIRAVDGLQHAHEVQRFAAFCLALILQHRYLHRQLYKVDVTTQYSYSTRARFTLSQDSLCFLQSTSLAICGQTSCGSFLLRTHHDQLRISIDPGSCQRLVGLTRKLSLESLAIRILSRHQKSQLSSYKVIKVIRSFQAIEKRTESNAPLVLKAEVLAYPLE